MKIKICTSLLASIALSACGGTTVSLDDIKTELKQSNFFSLEEDGFGDPTPDGALPTSTASYTGFAIAGLAQEGADSGNVAFGYATIEADFAAGSVSGLADNFYQIDQASDEAFAELSDDEQVDALTGDAISGSFSLDLLQSVSGENGFEGSVSGSLRFKDGTVLALDDAAAGGGAFGPSASVFTAAAFAGEGEGVIFFTDR